MPFLLEGFPDSSVGKESACNAGDPVRFLGWEDPLEKRRDRSTHSWASLVAQLVKNPPAMWETWVQSLEKGTAAHSSYSSLENSMDCIVHGVAKSRT